MALAGMEALAARLETYAVKELPAKVNGLVVAVAVEIGATVAQSTPVDTARARSNWQGSKGTPTDDRSIRAYSPYPIGSKGGGAGRSEGSNLNSAKRQQSAAFQGRKIDEPLFLSNNLVYIKILDGGSSAQTPAGFVARAVAKGALVARKGLK